MLLIQVLLVFLVALFVSCEAAATQNQLTITTTDSTATAKALQKFFTEDATQNRNNGFLKVVTLPSSEEERASTSTGAITAGEGARAAAGTTVVSSDTTSGETVTVTVYNNNGLWQRFLRWWNRLFHVSSNRLLREGGKK
ncbi:hypothetical protein F442_14021 [Phytophthora nicotianae P10297]|uniref:RxLR effector protein n=2 Tax=Phytophthora nicotianae TaxID=4792 RepID=W2PXT4_PHYN3|nr:hypothetical protein PPTG_14580 [Phytophthora nicotianae INRA-310]ETN04810.1 hypothetical protein PPTG_14580 [Phytophthora nicotianae INRA-310]ETP38342.1 hypothetical protein F442_14021 [Phytophthora nicotianae P10297]